MSGGEQRGLAHRSVLPWKGVVEREETVLGSIAALGSQAGTLLIGCYGLLHAVAGHHKRRWG